jgi:protein-disulfide isomerase
MRVRLAVFAALALGACGLSCSGPGNEGAAAEPSPVVARLDDRDITLAELEAWLKNDLFERETARMAEAELYELRADALERLIDERLLALEAARRGLAPEALLERESADRVAVAEEEVRAFYDEHEARFGGADFATLAPGIRGHLEEQKASQARRAFLTSLRSGAAVSISMQPPRVPVAATGPSRGPATAPITIVEWSDFECPFCRRAVPVVDELLALYGERVRIVYRHFPLEKIHPRARGAAAAAVCAEAQGRFWEYHDRLFAGDAALDAPALAGHAAQLGLDRAAFDACLADPATQARIDADAEAGRQAGISGTPAFFVNGIHLSGARPLEDFRRVIDAELGRIGPAREAGTAAPGATR